MVEFWVWDRRAGKYINKYRKKEMEGYLVSFFLSSFFWACVLGLRMR